MFGHRASVAFQMQQFCLLRSLFHIAAAAQCYETWVEYNSTKLAALFCALCTYHVPRGSIPNSFFAGLLNYLAKPYSVVQGHFTLYSS